MEISSSRKVKIYPAETHLVLTMVVLTTIKVVTMNGMKSIVII